ncbi:hypothetical protein E4T38_00705 [Aureobasidium subglaciale]|nr:hypothetical protein E4T38_00705 [Aureobasidium subglaciale]KAI5231250.1 hypothetical protein E4T40_00706 [Aureobasidium subglaciale]KAI5234155.1 hypothetical protein E4T41_00704 [Aureobasidium subglaciale]KAI5267698.1 hypothetical protein E4T46_00704 [Aureobasidium subglaciale]
MPTNGIIVAKMTRRQRYAEVPLRKPCNANKYFKKNFRRGHRCLPSKMFRRHPLKPFLLLTSGTTALAASPESSSQVPLQRDATYALLSGGPGVKRAVTRHSDFLDCTSLRGEPVGSRQNDESRRTSRRC